MALARITGPISEHAIELIEQLRRHGYDVVQNSDANDPTPPVDLEIDLLECSSDEVLSQIHAFGEEDLTVMVAPGALEAPVVPATEVAINPKTIVEEEPINAVTEAEIVPEVPEQIVDAPVFAMDDVAEPEPADVIVDTPALLSIENSEPEPEAVPDAMNLAMENTSEVEAEHENTISDVQVEFFVDVPAEQTPQASLMEQSVPAIHERPEESELGDFDSAFLSENAQETVPESLAETEPQFATEPETESHAELAHTAQSSEGLSDWPIWQVLQEETGYEEDVPDVSQSSPDEHRAFIRRLQTSCERIMIKPSFRWLGNERVFNRTASATVAIGIALLVLGTVTHRFRPLPSRVEQGTTQAREAAPFQKTAVTANNAGSLLQGPVADASSPAPFANAKSLNKVESAAKTQSRPAAVRPASDADYVATNTIVRYRSRVARRKVTSDANPTGVKYYTDLKPASR